MSRFPCFECQLRKRDAIDFETAMCYYNIERKCVCPDTGRLKIRKENIMSEQNRPLKPLAAEIRMPCLSEGLADGTVTVTLDTEAPYTDTVLLRWADGNGRPLEGYALLARRRAAGLTAEKKEDEHKELKHDPSAGPTVLKLPRGLLIPDGAAGILVSGENGAGESEALHIKLPAIRVRALGKPVMNFQVVSDIHINSDDKHQNGQKNTAAMLRDIAEMAPDSTGIMVAGDIADRGRHDEHEIMKQLVNDTEGVPPVTYVIGNHDYGFKGVEAEAQREEFLSFSGTESVCFDRWFGGYHFIFLASADKGCQATFGQTEEEWLCEKLAEKAEADRPIFVFCHQSVMNTVAGSTAEEEWWGIRADCKIAETLAAYPQAILFSGHSHWELISENEVYYADDRMCGAVNTSSVAYLWTALDIVKGEFLAGSEGIFVDVYENGSVLIRGRDFMNRLWAASARFMVIDREKKHPDQAD